MCWGLSNTCLQGARGIFLHSPVQLKFVYHKDQWRNINIKLFSVAWFISLINSTRLIGKLFAPGCAHPQSQAGLSQPNNSKGPGSFVVKIFKFDSVTKKLELFKQLP